MEFSGVLDANGRRVMGLCAAQALGMPVTYRQHSCPVIDLLFVGRCR